LVLMGDFPGGPLSSEATDLSANGTVIVGQGRPSEDEVEAFRWTAETGMVGLGHLPSSIDLPYSAASSVSVDGSVIVGFSTSGNTFEAFRWTAASGMKGLGFLSEENPSSHAFTVSADGEMVGGWSGTLLAETAFIWTEAEGMRTLWDILLSLGVNPAADGWETFRYVARFSADGRYVVGTGRRNGRDEGFIAEIGGPQLSYARVDAKIELSWPGGFRLERRTVLNMGSWEPMVGDSPIRVEMGERQEFYRLVGVR
jgi:probable HAF family extracellular repeat protein